MDELREIQASLRPAARDNDDDRRCGDGAYDDRRRSTYANDNCRQYAPLPLTIGLMVMALAVIMTITTSSLTRAFLYSIKDSTATSHSLCPLTLTCLIS